MENKQIVFTGSCAVELQDAPIPVPDDNQVLIKTKRTLISTGTELSVLSGQAPSDSVWVKNFSFPYVAGYTNLGEVIDCGKNISRLYIGKKIVSSGNHANYVVADIDETREVPDDVPDSYSVFFNLAEIAMHGVRKGEIRWGDAVAIYGAGILGQLAAQFCLICGARKVFVIDISNYRLGLLPKHPRLISINPEKQDITEIIMQYNHGRLVDIVYELTGNQHLIPTEFKLLREQGTMVIISSPLGPSVFDFHDWCNRPSLRIIGAHNFSHPKHETAENPWTNKRDCEFFFDMCRNGDIDMSRMISTCVPYTKAPETYAQLLEDRGRFMGVVIDWK